MDLKETDILGDHVASHWYYRSKAAATRRLLAEQDCRVVLDVGSGSAFFSRDLMAAGKSSEAWCVDICYDADRDAVEAGNVLHFRRSIDAVPANVVLLMDVLEHVDDDVGLLSEYVAKVPVGTTILISVPAFGFLWSGHDIYLEHKRRYTLPQLEAVVTSCGLAIDRSAYYFGLLFPLVLLIRLGGNWRSGGNPVAQSQLRRHGRFTNALFAIICRLELPLMAVNRFAGLTVFCVARKT